MNILAYIMTGLTIAGTIGNAMRKRWCFYLWAVSNVFWSLHNLTAQDHPQAILYAFNMVMAIYGLCRWKKEENAERRWEKCSRAMPEEGEKTLAIVDAYTGSIRFYHARLAGEFAKNGWSGTPVPQEKIWDCEWMIAEVQCREK